MELTLSTVKVEVTSPYWYIPTLIRRLTTYLYIYRALLTYFFNSHHGDPLVFKTEVYTLQHKREVLGKRCEEVRERKTED